MAIPSFACASTAGALFVNQGWRHDSGSQQKTSSYLEARTRYGRRERAVDKLTLKRETRLTHLDLRYAKMQPSLMHANNCANGPARFCRRHSPLDSNGSANRYRAVPANPLPALAAKNKIFVRNVHVHRLMRQEGTAAYPGFLPY